MRIEYTFQKISKKDKLSEVLLLTDEIIEKCFGRRFEAEFVKPFQKWNRKNYIELVDLVKKCRGDYTHWCMPFALICKDYEIENNCPLLLDVGDLEDVIKELETGIGGNHGAKYKNICDQLSCSKMWFGDRKRLEEVLEKVREMYSDEKSADDIFLGKAKK